MPLDDYLSVESNDTQVAVMAINGDTADVFVGHTART